MSKKGVKDLSRFIGGIGEFTRESTIQDAYAFGRSIDVRNDPQDITLLPRTIKESGTVITALPKWAEYISECNETYIYDEAGNIYKRSSTPTYSLLHTVSNSHGNGMSWFGEDNFLYYTSDTLIGRYGPMCSASPTFVDDFFGSQGGVPLNTKSLDLEASSSQYAWAADSASLSITGSLSLECWIKPESLPTSGNQMTLMSKWTENGNQRSYKLFLATQSNYFGDGSDGALVISADTTFTAIDSACSGTSGAFTLTATNTSFAAGQVVMVIQMQGTGAGSWQRNTIQSYTAGTITLVSALNTNYSSSGVNTAQVLVLKQYTNVTVNTGITWTAKAWTGTVGGILMFLANGTVTISGTIYGTGKGFRGANSFIVNASGSQGEGTGGPRNTISTAANGNGGGGGAGSSDNANSGGGGGGNGEVGGNGEMRNGKAIGIGGSVASSTDLTTLTLGGGGGTGGGGGGYAPAGAGGNGGAIVGLWGTTVTTSSGSLVSNGTDSSATGFADEGFAGGGGGGAIFIKTQVGTLGTLKLSSVGGAGGHSTGTDPGNNGGDGGDGGAGGTGRVHIDYFTSYTGTTTPTLNATQDPNLGSSDGYTINLSLSSTGTNVETYTKPISISTAIWQEIGVSWDQSISTAEFIQMGTSLGTQVGALTAIYNSTATFNVGVDKDSAGNPQHYFDGLTDEHRIGAGTRLVDDFLGNLYKQINPASAGLQAYYQFNATATDATANANNLTLVNAPVYSTDVPFSSPTTRVDIDVADTTPTGNTYALPSTIIEDSANKKDFTPTKDPQKSIRIFVSAKGAGTGSWTMTVHDQYNNTIAAKTVAKTALSTGDYEFVFANVWRPLTNFTNSYHFHLTDSDATGTAKTGSANDLSTVNYTTYYQFLVDDTFAHPVGKMLQFLFFLNERYIATLEATLYDPNRIAFPAGFRARCYGYWQEYLAVGVIRGDDVTDQDIGRIYFWDGFSPTYNFYVDVPQGGVTALLGSQGKLFIWAGYQGEMLIYEGGDSVTKLRRVPYMETSKYMITYPGAVTMWKSLIRYGVAGESDSTGIYRGVYSFGSTNYKYPDILTYDYPISTGSTQGTSLRIGMTTTVNKKLLIGWGDGTGYGVDNVDDSNSCYPTGTIEFLIDDHGSIWKEKEFNTFTTKVVTLSTGQSLTPKVILDDETTWTYGETTDSSSTENNICRFVITNQRFYEVQYGLDIATTSGVSPTIKGCGIEIDMLEEEERV